MHVNLYQIVYEECDTKHHENLLYHLNHEMLPGNKAA